MRQLVGTLNNVKVRVRAHNPHEVIEREFNGKSSIEEAIIFLRSVR